MRRLNICPDKEVGGGGAVYLQRERVFAAHVRMEGMLGDITPVGVILLKFLTE